MDAKYNFPADSAVKRQFLQNNFLLNLLY